MHAATTFERRCGREGSRVVPDRHRDPNEGGEQRVTIAQRGDEHEELPIKWSALLYTNLSPGLDYPQHTSTLQRHFLERPTAACPISTAVFVCY